MFEHWARLALVTFCTTANAADALRVDVGKSTSVLQQDAAMYRWDDDFVAVVANTAPDSCANYHALRTIRNSRGAYIAIKSFSGPLQPGTYAIQSNHARRVVIKFSRLNAECRETLVDEAAERASTGHVTITSIDNERIVGNVDAMSGDGLNHMHGDFTATACASGRDSGTWSCED